MSMMDVRRYYIMNINLRSKTSSNEAPKQEKNTTNETRKASHVGSKLLETRTPFGTGECLPSLRQRPVHLPSISRLSVDPAFS